MPGKSPASSSSAYPTGDDARIAAEVLAGVWTAGRAGISPEEALREMGRDALVVFERVAKQFPDFPEGIMKTWGAVGGLSEERAA